MKFCFDDLLPGLPFFVAVKKEIVGEVIAVCCFRNGSNDIILEEDEYHEQIHIRFPKDSCTPYIGDLIEVCYKRHSLPFFESHNDVLVWSRRHSQIQEVHNTVHTRKPNVWLGSVLHK